VWGGEFQFKSPITALSFPHEAYALVGLENGLKVVRIELVTQAGRSNPFFDSKAPSRRVAPVDPDERQGDVIVGLADGQILVRPRTMSGTLKLPWVARQIVAVPDRLRQRSCDLSAGGRILRYRDRARRAMRLSRGYSPGGSAVAFDTSAFGESSFGGYDEPSGRPPISLLERDILPERDGLRTLAVSSQSRRLALLRDRAIDIRPLVYRLDAPTPGAVGKRPEAVPA